jgi:hypothetical protein
MRTPWGTADASQTVAADGGLQLQGGINHARRTLTLTGAGYWGNALDNASGDTSLPVPLP